MGLFDGFRGEFIDIIEWLDDTRDTIVWRFPRPDNEIKNGAQLIVRPGQTAVFVNEGQVADTFDPGTHTLTTQNLPILSTLRGWKYGFDSPFKAEVYFVATRQFTDQKWGTQNPIMVRDPEFGMVRLRAFGGYAMRVTDPKALLTELVGTDPQFRTDEVTEYLRTMVVSRLTNALATSGVSMLDLAAKQSDIGLRLAAILSEDLGGMGLTITQFMIENISVPPEVEAALDKRTQMGVVGNLDQYTKFQAANALEDAAKNPGGGMGASMGMGMGMGMGQAMSETMRTGSGQGAGQGPQDAGAGAASAPTNPSGPPPLPGRPEWYVGVGGQQTGPMAAGDVAAKVRSGEYPADALVWRHGMSEWTPAEHVGELTDLLASLPPHLPPTSPAPPTPPTP
ncbi:MAG: SPFH domain-containing protein [Dermatophilaceae bacterium]